MNRWPPLRYRIRNSSQREVIENVVLTDTNSPRASPSRLLPETCALDGVALRCALGTLEGGDRVTLEIPAVLSGDVDRLETQIEDATPAVVTGDADNILTSLEFTWENFREVFDAREFWAVIWATLFYTVVGTFGALIVGLFAALLLNKSFRGQGVLRGLYLFPYVAPVIAVAFTWVILLDPFSGSVNALLVQMGVTESSINFFGERPLALIMVTVFEIWRYFPLSFLFILARMQSIDHDMYEAADIDGASPFQKFRYLSLPMLMGILSVLFLLRFIWTFKQVRRHLPSDGGQCGHAHADRECLRTGVCTVEYRCGRGGWAVVILLCLLVFSWFFFRFMSKEEGL